VAYLAKLQKGAVPQIVGLSDSRNSNAQQMLSSLVFDKTSFKFDKWPGGGCETGGKLRAGVYSRACQATCARPPGGRYRLYPLIAPVDLWIAIRRMTGLFLSPITADGRKTQLKRPPPLFPVAITGVRCIRLCFRSRKSAANFYLNPKERQIETHRRAHFVL